MIDRLRTAIHDANAPRELLEETLEAIRAIPPARPEDFGEGVGLGDAEVDSEALEKSLAHAERVAWVVLRLEAALEEAPHFGATLSPYLLDASIAILERAAVAT